MRQRVTLCCGSEVKRDCRRLKVVGFGDEWMVECVATGCLKMAEPAVNATVDDCPMVSTCMILPLE